MEAFAASTAASLVSEIGHGTTWKVAGQALMVLECVIESDVFHPDVRRQLADMDLNASLSTVQAMLSDLEPALLKSGRAMKVCFKNLGEIVEQIQKELIHVEWKC